MENIQMPKMMFASWYHSPGLFAMSTKQGALVTAVPTIVLAFLDCYALQFNFFNQ